MGLMDNHFFEVGVKDLAVYVITSMVGFIGHFVGREIKKMRESVNALNINLAVIVEKVSSHERIITRHEDRLTAIETKKPKG
jgi:hypothetical protein